MHSNMWNLRSSKERLEIIERTEAHKRHLISILSAKSKIDSHNSLRSRQSSSPLSLSRKKVIQQDNAGLAKRIMQISRTKYVRPADELSEVGRNLKTYSSVGRNLRQKAIDE